MTDLSAVPEIAKMGHVKLAVLKMIYRFTTELTRLSPLTVQWIPLSQFVCEYKLYAIEQTYVYKALNALESEDYLDCKRFDETWPECRCKLYKLTDKFYKLLKE